MLANVCAICGKGPVAGRRYTHRGMVKKKGGGGRRTVRKNIRRFLPNLQHVRIRVNGGVVRARVCTDCIKNGRVNKASGRSTPVKQPTL